MVTSKKDIATSRKKIINATSKAIKDFSMIEDDDFTDWHEEYVLFT